MADVISTPKRATGKTGSACLESGPYSSGDNTRAGSVIVFIRKGERFPSDFTGTATTWTLVADGQRLSDGRLEKEPIPAP